LSLIRNVSAFEIDRFVIGVVWSRRGRAGVAQPVQEQEGIISLREIILGRHGHKPCLLVLPGSCGQSLARSSASDKRRTDYLPPARDCRRLLAAAPCHRRHKSRKPNFPFVHFVPYVAIQDFKLSLAILFRPVNPVQFFPKKA
jgi:hypothetical protein